MAIGGFLQGLGLAYGRDLIYGQQFEQKQAQTDLLKTEAQQAQMQTQQMQQQMKTQKDIGAFLKSQTDLEGADASQPMQQAKMYSKAAGLAASQGDLASAKEMTDLSKQANQEAMEQAKNLAVQQQVKKEALANTADDFLANPTREGGNDLVRKAVAAGVDPTTIPLPNTPAFGAWVNQQKLAGMDSKTKAEFLQKAADTKARREEQWQVHADNVDLRRAQMQQTAQFREMEIGLRRDALADRAQKAPQNLKINEGIYEFDPNSNVKGERLATDPRYVKIGDQPLTAQQKGGVSRLHETTGEAARTLTNLTSLDVTARTSAFAGLHANTPFEAMEKVGTNVLTGEQTQQISAIAANVGNQIASAESAFGGRMPNATQQSHIESSVIPQPGDTGNTALYKIANGKEILLTAIESAPKAYRNSQDAQDRIAALNKAVPWSTQDIINRTKNDPKAAKDMKTFGEIGRQTEEIKQRVAASSEEAPLPGGGDPEAGTSAPPIPANIQSLVDKYRSK